MNKLKTFSGKELVSILQKLGFTVIRTKGSHHYLSHEDGRATVIPVHNNEDIGKGLFQKILHDIEMSKSEFEEATKK